MALPKYRKSKSKTMMRRRQNDKRTLVNVSACPDCGAPRPAHRVCPSCGMYKGKTVVRKA
ncbi:MAG: 50S ribosomal protein L32 [Spirochaetes bacterium]|nr:50S ribosomal protein L32 [Spirochaetota bacterium]